jgi:hypothetical protein
MKEIMFMKIAQWRAPKLLDRLQREFKVENNGKVNSSRHAP